MVLPHWRCSTHPLLLSRPSLPPHTLALRQHPCHGVRTQFCPTYEWGQCNVVGPRRFHLPMVHEALPFPLVATVQLSPLGGTGRWSHHWHVRHILFTANAVDGRHRRQLVGQFCMGEYGGRAVDSSEDARSGRKIWTEHVVLIFPILYYCSNPDLDSTLNFSLRSFQHHVLNPCIIMLFTNRKCRLPPLRR